MNPKKVRRENTKSLMDLPNIGPKMAETLRSIKIETPQELVGCDPFELYERLYKVSGKWKDPCVLDTFMSIVSFMNGKEPQVWWAFTAERKKILADKEV